MEALAARGTVEEKEKVLRYRTLLRFVRNCASIRCYANFIIAYAVCDVRYCASVWCYGMSGTEQAYGGTGGGGEEEAGACAATEVCGTELGNGAMRCPLEQQMEEQQRQLEREMQNKDKVRSEPMLLCAV
eukprot:1898557-Rhodomonas_salina.2